jgi:hypothetical protein
MQPDRYDISNPTLLRRFNRNAYYIDSLRIGLAILNLSNHPVLGLARVGSFCRGPWSGPIPGS